MLPRRESIARWTPRVLGMLAAYGRFRRGEAKTYSVSEEKAKVCLSVARCQGGAAGLEGC